MTNEQSIENLKKLKSFHIHNGNYDPDIDRAIKTLEQQSNMVSRSAYEQVMWERDVAITQLKELGYGLGEKPKTGHWIDSPNGYFTHCSECGLYGDKGIYKYYGWCPKCGAKMDEPQERSGKCSKCEYHTNPDYTRCKECGEERSDKE